MPKITELIQEILLFSKYYDKEPALPCNSEKPKQAIAALEELSIQISKQIPLEFIGNFKTICSKGAGTYPRVSWMSVLPKNERVSNSLSITTCFSRDGNGLVAGLMAPSNNRIYIKTVHRTNSQFFLNVDGMSELTKYNNQFINPREFYLKKFNEENYIKHLIESLNLFSVNNVQN